MLSSHRLASIAKSIIYEKSATDLSTLADPSKQNAELCHIAESAHVAAARESGSGFLEMVVDRRFEMPASLEK
jgi:hypothetical protein